MPGLVLVDGFKRLSSWVRTRPFSFVWFSLGGAGWLLLDVVVILRGTAVVLRTLKREEPYCIAAERDRYCESSFFKIGIGITGTVVVACLIRFFKEDRHDWAFAAGAGAARA